MIRRKTTIWVHSRDIVRVSKFLKSTSSMTKQKMMSTALSHVLVSSTNNNSLTTIHKTTLATSECFWPRKRMLRESTTFKDVTWSWLTLQGHSLSWFKSWAEATANVSQVIKMAPLLSTQRIPAKTSQLWFKISRASKLTVKAVRKLSKTRVTTEKEDSVTKWVEWTRTLITRGNKTFY